MKSPPSTIDLDSNATTRPDPRVVERVLSCMRECWGNPSSRHALGERAAEVVREARVSVASLIEAQPEEIVFTSGATEAINLAIRGTACRRDDTSIHIVASAIEHKAVIETLEELCREDYADVTFLSPDSSGVIRVEQVASALRPNTGLVCILHGNNEIGTLNPVDEIGDVLRHHPALYLVDAAQTCAYLPPSARLARFDLAVISAHKMYGPKGVGALYVRQGTRLSPVVRGGGQECGLRSGTHNVPGIAGFGEAARVAVTEGRARAKAVAAKRDVLLGILRAALPDAKLNGAADDRLPGNISLTIPYVEARVLMDHLGHIAMSQSSACSSGTHSPSHVLRSIGLSNLDIEWTIRIGVSVYTTDDEIRTAAAEIIHVCRTIRGF